jgi:hypothetical protein
MYYHPHNLLRLVAYGDGPRASARFDIQKPEARDLPSRLVLGRLKRRKRRAPVPLNAGNHIARSSINRLGRVAEVK